MNFLAPALLWGLLAASIPVIIHLLNRRRFRTVQWAATTFLLKASRESRGKKRLKHILILTCRTLAIAALISGVARPLLGNFLGWGSGSVETVILILDRSPSMEIGSGDGTPSQREAVLTRIEETITQMGSPRLVLIDSATEEFQDVPTPDALPDLSTTQATDTQADIPGLLLKTIDYLQETKPGKTEIWLASDLQRGDWRGSDSRWQTIQSGFANMTSPAKLRILAADFTKRQNMALELISSRRVEDDLFLDLRIIRTNAKGEASVAVTYSLNGSRTAERVTISGQETRFQKRLSLGASDEDGYGFVSLTSDLNPRDDAVYFAYGERTKVQSYLITEEPTSETASYLRRAASPPGLNRYQCQVLTPAQTSRIDFSLASLIIWQSALPKGAVSSELTQYVEDGGSVLFLPATEPITNAPETIFGTSWTEASLAPDDQFFITGSWTNDDGPWANGLGGETMPLKELRAVKRLKISGDATILAEWDDKEALMRRHLTGKGTAIFLGTLPDDRWSNLEFTGLHLVAVQRLIQKGADRLHSGYRALAGSAKAMTKNDEVRSRLDTFEDFDPSQEHFRAGVFRLGERTVAANRASAETSPETVSDKGLKEILKDTPYSLFKDQESDDDFAREAWRAFLIAMVLFLIAEALLCLQPKRADATSTKPRPAPAS